MQEDSGTWIIPIAIGGALFVLGLICCCFNSCRQQPQPKQNQNIELGNVRQQEDRFSGYG